MSETPKKEETAQNEQDNETVTPAGGVGASTRRFANHPVGRWVAAGAAVVVALFSGVLIGRATEQDSADAGPPSFGRPDGDGPPMGGQAPLQGNDGFGDQGYDQSYGDDDDDFGPPQSSDESQDESSGGSSPAPLQTGQS